MEHDGSLLTRQVGPVVEGRISSEVLHMLKRKLPALTTSLALRAYAHPLRESHKRSQSISCDAKHCCYSRVI